MLEFALSRSKSDKANYARKKKRERRTKRRGVGKPRFKRPKNGKLDLLQNERLQESVSGSCKGNLRVWVTKAHPTTKDQNRSHRRKQHLQQVKSCRELLHL
jgi:transposase